MIKMQGEEERRTATHRGEVEKGVSTHQAGLPARERGATPRGLTLESATKVAKELAGGEYKWADFSDEERARRVADVFNIGGVSAEPEDAGRDPAQGRKIAAPAAKPSDGARADGAVQRTLRDGRKVWVKRTPEGKWVEVR